MRAALRELPAEVWALGAVSLLTDAATDMIYPLLPQLLLLVGGGAVALGTLEGTAELVSSLVKAWAGRAADKGGKHGRYVIAGYGLASFARPLLGFISAPWQAVFFRSLDRLGKGLRSAPRDAILARVTAPERRGLAFGVHQGMDNLGAVVGPLFAWALLSGAHLDVRTVIKLAIIPGILATIAATWAVRKETNAPATIVDENEPASEIPRSARTFLVITAVFALGASADSFLLMRLQGLGLPIAWVPIAWVTLQLGKALLNAPGGALADRWGPRRVLLGSWVVYGLAYAAFAFAPNWPIFWAIFVLYALHYGLGEGAEKSLITSMVPKSARGTAFGLQHAVHGFALLPANLVFGALYTFKPWVAFALSAALALVAAVALMMQPDVRQSA